MNLIEAKRNYKRSEAKLERQYLREEGNLLDHLRKDNPKIFYKHFRKRKPKHTSIELDLFRKHFEDLSTLTTDTDNDPPVDTGTTVFEELDTEITVKEISDAIDNLKRDKSHGLDYILNEYFIEFKGILMPCLHLLVFLIVYYHPVIFLHNGQMQLLFLFLKRVTQMTPTITEA